jgi:YedE family putative selenium metabolism protein
MDRFLTSRHGPVWAGGIIGVLAAGLVKLGNPGNMGICVACFTRDISGALGLHRAAVVQYLRPEIPGFIIGAYIASHIFGEHRPRGGSSPLVRFFLGVFAMVGGLVFLGCPWRAYLRIAGGDLNAIAGIAGLAAGILLGTMFLSRGFNLGPAKPSPRWSGVFLVLASLALMAFLLFRPLFGSDGAGPIFFSESGPGSLHAPVAISLLAGLAVGYLAQRSRFCTVGAIRDLIMLKDSHLIRGVAAFIAAAWATDMSLGLFNPGFEGQPVAHTMQLWNFMGMVLSGLAFSLAGGCPGRQLIMAGEGDNDAGIFALGMLMGAAFAHNFNLASSGAGVGAFGIPAVVTGMVFCIAVGAAFVAWPD